MQITTLVPAYKPKYLLELLSSMRHQVVKPARIIISDDSPQQAFVAALSAEPLKALVADLNVEVVAGPRLGAYGNIRYLMHLYGKQTALFHILNDDDIPYPDFYERHLQAHAAGSLRAVVSRRWTALESGQPVRDLSPPDAIHNHPQRMLALDSSILFEHTVGRSANWLGEFSNATFSADMVEEMDDPSLNGICFTGLEDLGAFLKASLHGPVGYINEHLGFFRTSSEQHSANSMGRPLKLAFLAYMALAIAAQRLCQLTTMQCYGILNRVSPFISYHYGSELDLKEICALMPRLAKGDPDAISAFLALWHVYSGSAARPEMAVLVGAAR